MFLALQFQSNDFLHTQSHIHLSVIIAKFCFLYVILFCSVLMKNSIVLYEAKNRILRRIKRKLVGLY